jgi:hypothetical protein
MSAMGLIVFIDGLKILKDKEALLFQKMITWVYFEKGAGFLLLGLKVLNFQGIDIYCT